MRPSDIYLTASNMKYTHLSKAAFILLILACIDAGRYSCSTSCPCLSASSVNSARREFDAGARNPPFRVPAGSNRSPSSFTDRTVMQSVNAQAASASRQTMVYCSGVEAAASPERLKPPAAQASTPEQYPDAASLEQQGRIPAAQTPGDVARQQKTRLCML